MRKPVITRFLLLISSTVLFSACSLFRTPQSSLQVVTNVPSDVYLDAKSIGTTGDGPLTKKPLEVKKYQLKIVPQDPTYLAQETQIKLFPDVEAMVDWTFGRTRDESSGYVVEAENAHKRDASEIEIITSPDNVPVTINNENKGFSPLVIDDMGAGDYQLGLAAPGFAPSTRMVKLVKGKRIVITVKLARKPVEVATASAQFAPMPTPTPTTKPKATPKPTPKLSPTAPGSAVLGSSTAKKPYVEILQTPTGFLRVRSQPAASGAELGQLNVGQTAPYGGTTTDNWFKIVFGATSSAWVSGQYSRLVQ